VGEGTVVTVGGILSSVTRKVTKRGDQYAQAILEDLEGAIEIWFFPNTYSQYAVHVAEDAVVVVKAKLDKREDAAKLVALEVRRPDLSTSTEQRGPVRLRLDSSRCTEPVIEKLKAILGSHPGLTEVHLDLVTGDRTTTLRLDDGLRVTASHALYADLKQLLGGNAVAV